MAASVLRTHLDCYKPPKQKCTAVMEVSDYTDINTIVFHCEREAYHEGKHQTSGLVGEAGWTVMWGDHREAHYG